MSGRHCKLIFFLIIVICTATGISAQTATATATTESFPEKTLNTDTVFTEMYLTEDGVAAVDLNGDDWYFDFNLDMFVIGLLQRTSVSQNEINDTEPIETRCIIEKRIKPSISKVVIIDVDEFVDHDIIVFGRVTVKGWVKGNITSYNNRVIVKSTGQVDGDINAPKIIVHDNGVVLGEINETTIDIPYLPTDLPDNGFMVIMIIMSTLAVFLFLTIALLPKKLEVVSDCFSRYKLRSSLMGFLFFMLMPVVLALVAITIVGIVVLPLVPLVYLFAVILGVAAFSNLIGNYVFGRFLSAGDRMFMKTFLGFSLFAISWIIGISLMTDATDSGIGIFFFVISIIFSLYPVFGGIGASILTRFGTRPYASWKDKISENPQNFRPAPPPMPKAPEIKVPFRRPDNS